MRNYPIVNIRREKSAFRIKRLHRKNRMRKNVRHELRDVRHDKQENHEHHFFEPSRPLLLLLKERRHIVAKKNIESLVPSARSGRVRKSVFHAEIQKQKQKNIDETKIP